MCLTAMLLSHFQRRKITGNANREGYIITETIYTILI